jgi:glutathione synthase
MVYHVGPRGVRFRPHETCLRGVRLAGDARYPFGDIDPESVELSGEDLDAVLIRTDPPFDGDYLADTQLLDLLRPLPFLMNRPSGLRDANEKLAALHFPDLVPETCITSNTAEIEQFRREQGGVIVLKPLLGHGGAGVCRLEAGQIDRIEALTARGRNRVVAQALVPGAERGDKRIILLDGEPLGAVLRRNDQGGFVHNLAAGGSAHPAEVSEADRAICSRVAPWLRERGLWLAGIDILGGRLIEINVTSPTCVQEINRFNGVRLEREIVDFVERRVSSGAC